MAAPFLAFERDKVLLAGVGCRAVDIFLNPYCGIGQWFPSRTVVRIYRLSEVCGSGSSARRVYLGSKHYVRRKRCQYSGISLGMFRFPGK